jgi:hypothetical protein
MKIKSKHSWWAENRGFIAETCIFVSDKISHRKEQPGRLGTEEKIPRPSHEMFPCKHF